MPGISISPTSRWLFSLRTARSILLKLRVPALAVAALVGATASPLAFANDAISVVISGQGSLAGTAYIASTLGYFKQQGLDVTVLDGGGGSNAVNTLVSGGAQIGIVGIKLASQAVEKGQSLKVVGSAIQGFPNYVVVTHDWVAKTHVTPGSSFEAKATALKGQIIAVNDIGGSSGEFARYVLNAAKVPVDQVTLINMTSSAARLAALKRGRVNAIIGGDPEPEQAATDGYGVTLINPATDMPAAGRAAYMVQVVRADYLQQHRSIVERYLRATKQSEDLIKQHPDEARKAFFAFLDTQTHGAAVDPKVADASWQQMLAYYPASLRLDPAQVAAARAFFSISPKVTDDTFIDNSVADSVLAGK